MTKKEAIYYKDAIEDIKKGMNIEGIVKKYPVSIYYARKWSKLVYKYINVDKLVRDRYRLRVCDTTLEIINEMIEAMTEDEAAEITDETIENWEKIIKNGMYNLLKEAVIKN